MIGLSEGEQRLVTAVEGGTVLDLSEAADQEIRAEVLRDLLRGRHAADPDPRGIRLTGATITGQLDLTGLRTEVPLALVACAIAEPVVLAHARLGPVRLDGCVTARIEADRLRTDGDLALDGLRCTGGISLAYAEIGGLLSLQRARLDGGVKAAVKADGISVAGNVVLATGFHARSAGRNGTVRLPAAQIGGQLRLSGADLRNDGGGPALLADRAHVTMSIILTGLRAETDGPDAAVRVIGTRTESMLYLDGVELRNPGGAALSATALDVGADLRLGPGFEAHAHTPGAAVRLTGAHVRGTCQADGLRITNTVEDAPVLDLAQATVDGPLRLPVGDLVDGTTPFRVVLDGLTYRGVPGPAPAWLTMLRDHTPWYAAQPYQQLAAVHRAAGHERDTRRILIAQQQDLGARGELDGFTAQLWHRTSGVVLGHGYRPARALAGLLVALLLACLLVLLAGGSGNTTRTPGPAREPCTVTEHLALAADLSVPVVRLATRQPCALSPVTGGAQWFVVGGWVTTLLGWAFATLFVAGFTGLVRKT